MKIALGMSPNEFKRRERIAANELREIGELENARRWVKKHRADYRREGAPGMTPLEWALLEMPVGFAGKVFRFLGLD